MVRKLLALGLAMAGLAIAACGGRGGGGGTPGGVDVVPLPQMNSDLVMFATVPKDTIGEELPEEGVGTVKSGPWKATLGGYTQTRYAQALGFKPNTEITILNLSRSVTHTLDVVEEIKGPPANFPKNPKLPVKAHGGDYIHTGFASGPIKPGKSIKVRLIKPGVYLIGCAFHYGEGMHDVLVVGPHAAPGPQGTPPPSPTSSPTSRSSYDP